MFSEINLAKKHIELLNQEKLELQNIEREIYELEDTLDYLEMMRESWEDSEK